MAESFGPDGGYELDYYAQGSHHSSAEEYEHWSAVDPLSAAEAVLSRASYLSEDVRGSDGAAEEIEALAREMHELGATEQSSSAGSSWRESSAHDDPRAGLPPSGYPGPEFYMRAQAHAATGTSGVPLSTHGAHVGMGGAHAGQAAPNVADLGYYHRHGRPGGALSGYGASPAARGDSQAIAGALREMQQRVRALEAERSTLQAGCEAKEAMAKQLEQELTHARAEASARTSQLAAPPDAARTDVAGGSEHLVGSGASVVTLRAELEQLRTQAQAADADRRVAQAQLETLEAELVGQQAEASESTAEAERRATELEQQSSAARAHLEGLVASLAAERESRRRVEQQRAQADEAMTCARGRVSTRGVARAPRASLALTRLWPGCTLRVHTAAPRRCPRRCVRRHALSLSTKLLSKLCGDSAAHEAAPAAADMSAWPPAARAPFGAAESGSQLSAAAPSTPLRTGADARTEGELELQRVLGVAEREVRSAREEFERVVQEACDRAAAGVEGAAEPVHAALEAVQAKVIGRRATRRALRAPLGRGRPAGYADTRVPARVTLDPAGAFARHARRRRS